MHQTQIRLMVVSLLDHSNTSVCLTALRLLRVLLKGSPKRQVLVNLGIIPLLFKLTDHTDDLVCSDAIDLLNNISPTERVMEEIIASETMPDSAATIIDKGTRVIDGLINQIEHGQVRPVDHCYGMLVLLERVVQYMINRGWKKRIEGLSKLQPFLRNKYSVIRSAAFVVVHLLKNINETASA